MLRKFIISFAIVSACCCARISQCQGADAWEINARLGRAINLGNALEAPYEGQWGVTLREEYFQIIKDGGFTGVRIPIRWNAYAETTRPYTIDPDFFARVDWAVDNALSRGLVAVVNIHHYEELTASPSRLQQERFVYIWRQIAEHYQDRSDLLVFELLNEPHDQLKALLWNSLLREGIRAVRETNPDRIIVIGGAGYNSSSELINTLELPEDDRHIIATFHHYSPFQFTHQGASWVGEGSDEWLGTTWQATEDEQNEIKDIFDAVYNWSIANDRPVFMGEFGAYSKADMDSRVLWTAFSAREAEARGFSWAYWEFCSGFGAYDDDPGKWRRLLRALVPDAPVENQIRNGQFDFGTDHWLFTTQDRATGDMFVTNGTGLSGANALGVDIRNDGAAEASVMVRQMDLALENGTQYRLSFQVKAELERTMLIRLQTSGGEIYWQQTQEISTNPQTFTYIFQSPADNSQVGIYFMLGRYPGDVYIDNVSLKEAWDCEKMIETGLRMPADLSGADGVPDCHVDAYDLMAMAEAWLEAEAMVDISGPQGQSDGIINIYDLAQIGTQWMSCNDLLDTECKSYSD